MSIRNAWLALKGELPVVEVREIEVGAEDVTVYKVDCESHSIYSMCSDPGKMSLYGQHFLSCEEAFAAIGTTHYFHVETVKAVRVGNRYFGKHSLLSMAAKPKRAKGQAK